MEETQRQQTPVEVIKRIIASGKVMFITIIATIVAVLALIDVIVNRVDLAGYSIFGISIGEILGAEITHILDTISTIIFVFSIIGILPTIMKAVGFWLIKQGVKDDYASQKKMHIGFLIIKIPLYYSAITSALFGVLLIIAGVILAIDTEVFLIMLIALLVSIYFLLITNYNMGFVQMLASATNTMRTGVNMVEKRTFVIVVNWISAIIAFLGVFDGGFLNIILCICDGLYLIFAVSVFSDFNNQYGYASKNALIELRKSFMTDPSYRNIALTIGYKENPLNPAELTMNFSGSFKLLFGMQIPDEIAVRPNAAPRTAPVRNVAPAPQRTAAPQRAVTPQSRVYSSAPIQSVVYDSDQKLDVHLLTLFGADMNAVDERFSSLGKKVFRGDLECPIKPTVAYVFKDSVTEKIILRMEFINKMSSAIKKIKYDVIPCTDDGAALGKISDIEVAFDTAVEKDGLMCAQKALVIPDDATNGSVKVTYVEFSDGLFWDKGSDEFYFTTDRKIDYDMNLYLSING